MQNVQALSFRGVVSFLIAIESTAISNENTLREIKKEASDTLHRNNPSNCELYLCLEIREQDVISLLEKLAPNALVVIQLI